MFLPPYVARCIDALEAAGFAAYAVGGCVRDSLLGLSPHDYDLCTDARPEETQAVFAGERLVLAGLKHGTVSVITEGGPVEITTFRREGGYHDNRRPDWVEFVDDIRQDLARRDFTVNAMAFSPTRGLADPFGGEDDLNNRVLRAVGDPADRFREDSLRILRGVRFSVTYGLEVEKQTMEAMLAQSHLMENLARERVFEELNRLLPKVTTQDILWFAPILAAVIPEIGPMIDFDQHSPHHAYDLMTHTACVTSAVGPDPALRWAALLHDTGKIPTFRLDENGRGHFHNHAQFSAEIANEVLLRLRAPTALREKAVLLIDKHMARLEPNRATLRRQASRMGFDTVEALLELQQADMNSKGVATGELDERFAQVREILAQLKEENACLHIKDLQINGHDLIALGYQGSAIGQALETLLEKVLADEIPNERAALLEALKNEE